jgi:hypothetical protein
VPGSPIVLGSFDNGRAAADTLFDFGGLPPFQVQVKNNLTVPGWSNSGSPTSNRTATVPIQPGPGFIRVVGSP